MIIAHTIDESITLRCNELFNDVRTYVKDKRLIDLLNIFLEIYIYDIATKRVGQNPRLLEVKVYVDRENLDMWKENLEYIEGLANFVTEGDGDKWKVAFIPVEYEFSDYDMFIQGSEIDNVSLLSGGLDSFCGAYANEISNSKTLYCGYKTSNVDTSSIKTVSLFLERSKSYKGVYTYSRVTQKKETSTQRTRSLLFFSLAVATALKENVRNININENGIMTLNPSFQSRGTTKTTHPKTIYLYQKIIDSIGINVKLNHPFLFCTKGEMVNLLSSDYINFIKHTRSCSRSFQDPRYDLSSKKSCGTCVPCLLRKISLAAYDLEEFDNEYEISYNGDMNEKEYRSAFFYYETFNNAIKSSQIFSELNMRKSYYETDDYYERTYDMLKRFSREVDIFIKKYGG